MADLKFEHHAIKHKLKFKNRFEYGIHLLIQLTEYVKNCTIDLSKIIANRPIKNNAFIPNQNEHSINKNTDRS